MQEQALRQVFGRLRSHNPHSFEENVLRVRRTPVRLIPIPRLGIRQYVEKETREQSLSRLTRISGQVGGIARMIAEDRYCVDVVTQIAAVRAGLKRVSDGLLRDHLAHCVEHAIRTGDRKEQRAKVAELMKLLERLSS